MIFVLRQLQKKCREQNMGLHAAFIDIMKAYDTVSRDGPWKILIKLGCMSKFLTVLSSCTKDRIQVKLSDLSDTFPIGNCVKHSRTCLTDDSIFNLCRLPAQTKTTEELTYCWQTTAHCWCTQKQPLPSCQVVINHFVTAASSFGLTISLKKSCTRSIHKVPTAHPRSTSIAIHHDSSSIWAASSQMTLQ